MFFCFFHGRKCFFVKISFVFHGRQAFFLHFTIFTRGRRAFFFYFPLIWCFRDAVFPPWGSYWTHIGQSAARTSSSWKGASMGPCCRPRPCGGYSCPTWESIARQRQRICRVIACKLALDSFRLKSTEDQGKNWTSQHQGKSFTSIIRNVAAGWLSILSEFYHKIKKQRKKFGNIRKCSYLCPAFKNNAWQDWNKPSEGRMGEWLKPAVC